MNNTLSSHDKKMRYSKQREKIYEYLSRTMNHPNAEEIYIELKKEIPNISLGTVYRNLKVLQELGQINTLSSQDGVEHYDANCHKHSHFICQKCGKIIDIANTDYDALINCLDLDKEFITTKIELSIIGYCKKCKNN